jgi:phytanoyl-CoA hydroxylase
MVNQSSPKAQFAQAAELASLRERGYVVVPRFVVGDQLEELNRVARMQLAARANPLEFEADLRYPGAPCSRAAAGGETVRRLLDAYVRDAAFAQFGTSHSVRDWMEAYFGGRTLMSRVHHNCLMTKHPLYGSLTGWHRDIRYWSFAREDLVSVWLALGHEEIDNGALWFVPGSHQMRFDADRFDDAKFFRSDRADNAGILATMESPRLEAGDAVLFHCNTLHCAGRNQSDAVKFSLVFTYHAVGNAPTPGSRSASMPEVPLTPDRGPRDSE